MIIKNEQLGNIAGVEGRFMAVIAPSKGNGNGCFLNQKWLATRTIPKTDEWGRCSITVEIRYDDECKNGHNTFSITGRIRRLGKRDYVMVGCIHEEIANYFPELAHLIKWHLVSSDGPMHYIANTVYHATQHGATKAWIYYTHTDPLKLADERETCLCYTSEIEKIKKAETTPGYTVKWDETTAKTQNLDYARSSACWPEATDEELSVSPEELTKVLQARLPALMEAFRRDIEACGLLWEAEDNAN